MSLRRLFCAALLLAASTVAGQSVVATAQTAAVTALQSTAEPSTQSTGQTTTQRADSSFRELQVECTPASGAVAMIGKHGCVAGRVFRVNVGKNGNTHISLCSARKCSFQAVVSGHSRAAVGDLSHLHGKVVAVLGDVTESRGGHPIIIVKDRAQIRVTAGTPPPEFDAAQARPLSSGKVVSPFGKNNRAW